jgi:hypothetical protein
VAGKRDDDAAQFVAWWATQDASAQSPSGQGQATHAEAQRLAGELLGIADGGSLTQAHVDGYCKKLKRGFSGARTIMAANEVGEALLEWQQHAGVSEAMTDGLDGLDFGSLDDPGLDSHGPLDHAVDDRGLESAGLSHQRPEDHELADHGIEADAPGGRLSADDGGLGWPSDGDGSEWDFGDDAADDRGGGGGAGGGGDELPPLPEIDDMPAGVLGAISLDDHDHDDDGAAPDRFDSVDARQRELSIDERVDSIGGRDVFAASDPPLGGNLDLDLDMDADLLGDGQEHYVREGRVHAAGGGMDVDVDPNAPISKAPALLETDAVVDDAPLDPSLGVGIPKAKASAAPVGVSSSKPPRSQAPLPSSPPDEISLAPLTDPPPSSGRFDRGTIGLVVVMVLVIAGAAAFFLR